MWPFRPPKHSRHPEATSSNARRKVLVETTAKQERFSIVLLPSGEVGQHIVATAGAWARTSLLQRALWVVPADVESGDTGSARLSALLLDRDQASTVDVFDVLARSDLDLVQMIVLQILDGSTRSDSEQRRAALTMFGSLQSALPRALTAESRRESRIRLTALNLITAPTGLAGVIPGEVLFPQFTGNILATPEDRRCADQMDRFVRPGQPHWHWALAQAMAVGGLWAGMSEYPWEVLATVGGRMSAASEQGALILPIRGYGRVVASAPMARSALAGAMKSVCGQIRNTVMDDSLLPLTDPEPLLAELLDAFNDVDSGRIVYSTPQEAPDPDKNLVSFSVAMAEFRSLAAQHIAAVPAYFLDQWRARISRTSTSVLSGKRGHETIVFNGTEMSEEDFRADFERQAIANEASMKLISTGPPAAAPELWRTMRAASFAMLDGSPMPEGLPAPVVAGQQVVVASTNLVVPPPNRWTPTVHKVAPVARTFGMTGWVVGPCAPRDHFNAITALHAVIPRAAARRAQLESRLKQLASSRPVVLRQRTDQQATAPMQLPAMPPGPDQSATAAPAQPPPPDPPAPGQPTGDWAETNRLEAELADVNAVEQAARRDVASLSAWASQRESSLLWRLAAAIHGRSEQAGRDRQAAYEMAVQIPHIDFEEPRRARNQFARRFLWWLFLSLFAISVSAFVAANWAPTLSLTTLGWWLILLLIIGVSQLLILLAAHRRRSRLLRAIRQLRHSQRDAARRCNESAHAEKRMAGLYEQAAEWGEILAHCAYEPWLVDPRWQSAKPDAETIAGLPACVDLAVPNPDDEDSNRRLQNVALRTVASRGWRARSYERLARLALAQRDPLTTEQDLTTLDLDAPVNPNGSRAAMIADLQRATLKRPAATTVMAASLGTLYEDRLALVRHTVQAQNGELAPERTHILDEETGLRDATPRWQDFLSEVRSGRTEFSLATWTGVGETDTMSRGTVTTLLWMPERLVDDVSSFGTTARDVYERMAMPAVNNRGVELASRLDVGAAVEPNHFRLFSSKIEDPYNLEDPSHVDLSARGSERTPSSRPDNDGAPEYVSETDLSFFS